MRVLTVGELLVEIMRPDRNLPLSEPGTFMGPYPSGAPGIFIDAAAKLGISAGMIGAVGNDAFGQCIIDRLVRDGVDTRYIGRSPDKTTGIAFVTYYDDGSRDFLFHMKDSAAVDIAKPDDFEFAGETEILHISGTSLTIDDSVRELIYEWVRRVKTGGGRVTFDPNIRPELAGDEKLLSWYGPVLAAADILLPSGDELQWLTGSETPEEAAKRLHEQGISTIVRKMGERGCELYLNGAKQLESPGFRVACVDPTGAGDCFAAGVVYGVLHSWDWERTLAFANALGGLSTTVLGPMEGTPTLKTVLDFIQ